MSSNITRGGKDVRPSFNFRDGVTFDCADIAGQMSESIRNVLEDIRDKQMLQCDVRADIRKMRIALEKIARNTAKVRRKKLR